MVVAQAYAMAVSMPRTRAADHFALTASMRQTPATTWAVASRSARQRRRENSPDEEGVWGEGTAVPSPKLRPLEFQNGVISLLIKSLSFGNRKRGVNFAADDVPDNWNFNGSNPCLHHGGNYNQNQNHGPFYINYNNASNANSNIGCRLLEANAG